jgi:peptidoglycan/xylan/chitin deacetylase (PgdA/CDA1 family)
VVVTTSWDDDDRSGVKVAELLSANHLRGTFYVPTGRLGQTSCLAVGDLRVLSAAGFEIGAHTVSHAILTSLSSQELTGEVSDCKQVLQQALGREVTTFCYPRGRFNAKVVSEVKLAGYHGARGTQMLFAGSTFLPFEIPTTVQAYPHRRSNYIRNLIRFGAIPVLLKSVPELIQFEGWLQLGKRMFDRVLRHGGIWHLYGHPWEIEKLGLWPQLGEILEYVSNRSGVIYATNGQLLDLVKKEVLTKTENMAASRPHSLTN